LRNKINKPKFVFYILVLVLVILIVSRYFLIESKIKNQELRIGEYFNKEVNLEGRVVDEPDVRDTNTKLMIEAGPLAEESAFILVTVNKYPEYRKGDELKIEGVLQEPAVFQDFDYKEYLRNKQILGVIYYPQAEILSRERTSGLLVIKNKLRDNIYSSMPALEASILGALILGDKNRIADYFKQKLNTAGIRHLTAVSGMHIVIVSKIIMFLFLFLGLWKKQAIGLSLVFIFLFIALTGFQTSSIRAGIMGSLFLIGPLFGRKSDSARALTLAGLVMLAINPFLIYDAGFQLSFAAALGIILLSSTIKKYLKSEILASTLSAYIFTLPILVYSFGRLSLVGPITNLLVLPIMPALMVVGFIASLFKFLAFIPLIFLTYIARITDIFSQSWMVQGFSNIHWLWILAIYAALIPAAHYFKKREVEV
jgi:competence protein ComEC